MTDLSICILTYRVKDLLRECLESIRAFPPSRPFEIIVVDNHSEDGTREMLAQEYPEILWLENDRNLGYTQPMNQALRSAKGCFLMQLNPDTVVPAGMFDTLLAFMEDHPEVGICTPKVLNRDGSLQKQCRRGEGRPWDAITYFTGLSRLFPRSRFWSGYLLTFQDEDQINYVEAVSGSCMLIRREVVEKIGYLDERFFAYQEDTDFCVRARQAGWKIAYVPTARITHYGGEGGSKNDLYQAIYQWHYSYFLYYRKHLAKDYFFLFNWLFYGAMGVKLLLTLILTVFRRNKYAGSRKP